MTGGTYSLTPAPSDKFFSWQVDLFTLRVFARNLMRGNRRRNIFFHISFWCLTWHTNPGFTTTTSLQNYWKRFSVKISVQIQEDLHFKSKLKMLHKLKPRNIKRWLCCLMALKIFISTSTKNQFITTVRSANMYEEAKYPFLQGNLNKWIYNQFDLAVSHKWLV